MTSKEVILLQLWSRVSGFLIEVTTWPDQLQTQRWNVAGEHHMQLCGYTDNTGIKKSICSPRANIGQLPPYQCLGQGQDRMRPVNTSQDGGS
jgi:hypothetical protein